MRPLVSSLLLVTVCGLCAGSAVGESPAHAVLFTYRVTNVSHVEARNVSMICILPTSNHYQQVLDLQIDPEPTRRESDALGQEVVRVSLGTLGPRQTRSVRVHASVRCRPFTVSLKPTGEAPAPLDDEQREGLLEDDPHLQVEQLRESAAKLVEGKARDIEKASALFIHMVRHCRYDIDRERDLPVDVLAGEPASCSELAATYTALCRAVGIPARIISAYVNRGGTEPSADWRTHRWAEIHIDGLGWIPVDPTNQLNYPDERFFGKQSAKYVTMIDDGVPLEELSDPAWQCMLFYREPANAFLLPTRSAVWRVSADRQAESLAFDRAVKMLNSSEAATREGSIASWKGDLMQVAFLLEACYDPEAEVRLAAAQEIATTGDVSVMIALMDFARMELDASVRNAFIATATTLLKGADAPHRVVAVEELARSRRAEALVPLDGIWKDPATEVRMAAARLLHRIGDWPKVHEGYRAMVNDRDGGVAVTAALEWSKLGSGEATRALVQQLGRPEAADRERVLKALVDQTNDDFGFDPQQGPATPTNRRAIRKFTAWLDSVSEGG